MNERIKELAEQAASFAETAYNKQTMATFHTNKSAEEIFREKFAELIVRECSKIAEEYDGAKLSGPGIIIAGRIETHFGVEE